MKVAMILMELPDTTQTPDELKRYHHQCKKYSSHSELPIAANRNKLAQKVCSTCTIELN